MIIFVRETVKWFDQNSTIRSANGRSVRIMFLARATISGAKLLR